MKIKGYSLGIVIILMLETTIIVSVSLVLFQNRYNYLSKLKSTLTEESLLNSSIELLLSDTDKFSAGKAITMSLFNETEDSVAILRDLWGFIEIGHITLEQNQEVERFFFFGDYLSSSNTTALWLTNHQNELCLSGNVLIEGDCNIPYTRFKPIIVNGQGLTNYKPIVGKILESGNQLPKIELEDAYLDFNSLVLKYINSPHLEQRYIYGITVENSFKNEKTIIVLNEQSSIEDSISGKIIVLNHDTVHISKKSCLRDIILFGNNFIIESGFIGNLQIIASESIIIESDVELNYPSILSILSDSTSIKPKLKIETNAKFSGSIYLIKNSEKEINLELAKGATIEGFCYNQGTSLIKGNITGTLYSDKVEYSNSSSTYYNLLNDCQISKKELSSHFISSGLFTKRRGIIKWLK